MNLLIIGGTVFLGRHLVLTALKAGHKVTTFNRGNNKLAEQNEVERLTGDRSQVQLLSGRTWDAVIDTCAMTPDSVAESAGALQNSVGRYVFISSISAFDNFREKGMTEKAPVRLLPLDAQQDYGSKKAHCEKIVEGIFGKRSLIIRPGLIAGRYDVTDRFTYWPRRIAEGGQVLAPGRPARPLQFIDVRDLSEWVLRLVEVNISGTFNATGPGFVYTMKDLLQECKSVSKSQSELIWVPDEKLLETGVEPWSELPLWIPESDRDFAGFMQVDCTKAFNRGLSYRHPSETIRDVLSWDNERDHSVALKAGLERHREKALLAGFVQV